MFEERPSLLVTSCGVPLKLEGIPKEEKKKREREYQQGVRRSVVLGSAFVYKKHLVLEVGVR